MFEKLKPLVVAVENMIALEKNQAIPQNFMC